MDKLDGPLKAFRSLPADPYRDKVDLMFKRIRNEEAKSRQSTTGPFLSVGDICQANADCLLLAGPVVRPVAREWLLSPISRRSAPVFGVADGRSDRMNERLKLGSGQLALNVHNWVLTAAKLPGVRRRSVAVCIYHEDHRLAAGCRLPPGR
jgi:hypothetical protein